MTDTCYTSIRIAGDAAELRDMDAQMAEALTIPDSGDERWAGNLWLYMGLDPDAAASGKLGGTGTVITGHEFRDGLLYVEAESQDHPQLKAIDDFMKRYAPSGEMMIFVTDPDRNQAYTTGNDGDYASVLFTCEPNSNNPKARELDGWTTVWEQCDLLDEMARKVHMDASKGFDAVAGAFMEVYPVQVQRYAHEDIGQYLN